jgi:uncharacterized protein involved in exopolysaccharide biosynthesis
MQAEERTEEISALGLLAVLLRRWKPFMGITVAALLLATAFVLLRSPQYTAYTTLVPAPSKTDNRSDLLTRMPGGLAALAMGGNTNQKLVGVIAKSQALRDSVVRRLGRAGDALRSPRQVGTILRKRTTVKINPDGSVQVEVTAPEPRLAANVAAQFPDLINRIAAQLGRQTAMRKRQFLEEQLTTAGEALSRSEERLQAFQQNRDIPEVQEQARQTVQAAAELQRDIFEREARLSRLRLSATPGNPQVQAAEADLAARRAQLRRLTGSGGGGAVFVPLGTSPELKFSTLRLQREFSKNEQIYIALTAALAETQVDVNDNLPVVSVLDSPVAPTIPSGPSAPKVLVLAAFMGAALGALAAFALEFMADARRDGANDGFFAAWAQFRRDLGLARR